MKRGVSGLPNGIFSEGGEDYLHHAYRKKQISRKRERKGPKTLKREKEYRTIG